LSEHSDRLLAAIRNRQREGLQKAQVSDAQVALVARALADHTLLQAALRYRPDETSPWPYATSLGRFFHHLADELGPSLAANPVKDVDPRVLEHAVRALVGDAWVGHDEEVTVADLERVATVVLASAGYNRTEDGAARVEDGVEELEVWVSYADVTDGGTTASKPRELLASLDDNDEAARFVVSLELAEEQRRQTDADLGQPHHDAKFEVWAVETLRTRVRLPVLDDEERAGIAPAL
jgi:hypothetical protein